MSEILLYYRRPDPTTWVYLSSFLTIGLYFVFHRFWSVRNLDVILLILLAPGLLVVYEGRRRQLRQSEIVVRQRAELVEPSVGDQVSQPGSQASTEIARASRLTAVQATGSQEFESPESGSQDQETNPPSQPPSATDSDVAADSTSSPDDELENRAELAIGTDDDLVDPLAEVEPDSSIGGYSPTEIQRLGFIYLFVIQALLLLRLMLDPLMVRRPLLDPNLTTGGLNFIGISLFIFMMANVINSTPRIQVEQGPALGPGYALMNMLPAIPTRPVSDSLGGALPPTNAELTASQARLAQVAQTLAILAQLAIVAGIVLIANRHFGNVRAGFGCATLYLLLPYTAQMTGRVDHALPAALLLWAVLSYRRPMVAGIFLGLAGGLVYYPLFLLPLWFSFYWQRGARRFAIGVIAMLAVLMLALSFDSSASLTEHLQRMFGLLNPNRPSHELRGIWALGWNPIWRLPVIVAFVILSVLFASWPAQKNLGTLMSGTAAVMVGAQFWHGYGGGLYMAWFLPLLLLTVFRPNLQDRVSTKVVLSRGTERLRDRQELEPV